MKKVSELTGAELDYWVAKALGKNPCIESGNCMVSWNAGEFGGNETDRAYFQPSVNWGLGGQIIEHERIQIWDLGDEWIAKVAMKAGNSGCGHTVLVAAMRAYVSSKYGDSVPADAQEANQ
jgi:hypothetical protein